MDFLDQLIIPADANHLSLIKLLLIGSLMIFIPFYGMLLGGTFLSTVFNTYGRKIGSKLFVRFAKDIIDTLAVNRFVGAGLAVVPLLSITFSYAQLLYQVDVITVSLLFTSTLCMAISMSFIYSYQNSFQIESLLETMKDISGIDKKELDKNLPEHITEYEEDLMNTNSTSGLYAVLLLLISGFLFIGGTTVVNYSDRWQDFTNISQLFLSEAVFFNYLTLIFASFAITGISILFFFFRWQGGLHEIKEDVEYSNFVKKIAGTIAFGGAVLLPVMIFVSFITTPNVALSYNVFIYTALTLISILIVCNFLYAVLKNSEMQYTSFAFYMMLITLGFFIMKDQSAFANAIKDHTQNIMLQAEIIENEKKSKVSTTAGINVEEIFNTKCLACHKFDTKLVGPPYDVVVPKYNGDVNKLADFILNPTKIDPGYPPMPNQGLKPKEAEAMAKYLIERMQSP